MDIDESVAYNEFGAGRNASDKERFRERESSEICTELFLKDLGTN